MAKRMLWGKEHNDIGIEGGVEMGRQDGVERSIGIKNGAQIGPGDLRSTKGQKKKC